MTLKKALIALAVILFGLPVALGLAVTLTLAFLNRTNGSLVSSGVERKYLLYVPPTYDRSKPAPLVISLHGAAGWPAHQQNISHWNKLADDNGFIVAYPAGTGFPRIWHVGRGARLQRDVDYIAALIDKVEGSYNIDKSRIYANGLSNGGGMSFALSCLLPHRFAAIGLVASAQTLPFSFCTNTAPVPLIAFHGTADPIVPYAGGPSGDKFNPVKTIFPALREFTASWARRNQCQAVPVETKAARDVTRTTYEGCKGDAAVVLYSIDGGGHTWPGGKPLPEWWAGKTTESIDATAEMWRFFKERRLEP